MTFFEAIKTCLLKYADFEGRATRAEYWWFFLAVVIGSAVTSIISYKDSALFSLVTIVPMLAAGARRLHDTNKSGWWQLLGLAPFGVFIVFIFLAQESIPFRCPTSESVGWRA
jgi:uncharacterized membrane protein YhaH (DUF805 family)